MSNFIVAAFYHFAVIDNFADLKAPLLSIMNQEAVRGTILLAREGVNGTISGKRAGVMAVIKWIKANPALTNLTHKEAKHSTRPFHRAKVKLKKEIVTMGVGGIDPNRIVGSYVEPKDWNKLINQKDITLIDTRNEYEYKIGTFKNAVNPHTETFREFPEFVKNNLDPKKQKKIAMFCTGGIRCEKSTAYLKEIGFEEVYHLKGGILKYLEDVPKSKSTWKGECFVFDERVSVGHNLKKGRYDQCFACRMPISKKDKLSPHYAHGISCPTCFDHISPAAKQRFKEREKQILLAETRGEIHLGADATASADKNKKKKHEIRKKPKK